MMISRVGRTFTNGLMYCPLFWSGGLRKCCSLKRIQVSDRNASLLERSDENDRSAFTLLELLMVIVILGMLLGLLIVAVSRSLHRAKEEKTAVEVNTLASAIYAYRQEYGVWPGELVAGVHTNDETTRHVDIIESLSVPAPGVESLNPKRIEFVNWDDYRVEDYTILNPWGKAYKVVIDCEDDTVSVYDMTITNARETLLQ